MAIAANAHGRQIHVLDVDARLPQIQDGAVIVRRMVTRLTGEHGDGDLRQIDQLPRGGGLPPARRQIDPGGGEQLLRELRGGRNGRRVRQRQGRDAVGSRRGVTLDERIPEGGPLGLDGQHGFHPVWARVGDGPPVGSALGVGDEDDGGIGGGIGGGGGGGGGADDGIDEGDTGGAVQRRAKDPVIRLVLQLGGVELVEDGVPASATARPLRVEGGRRILAKGRRGGEDGLDLLHGEIRRPPLRHFPGAASPLRLVD